jgi:hypothetical protein
MRGTDAMVTGFHHCWSSGVARRVANRAVPWRHRVSARFGAITSAATFGPVSIHQIQVAFIGSGMLGGGTLSYRGAPYRFRLGGLGIGIAPRRYWNRL